MRWRFAPSDPTPWTGSSASISTACATERLARLRTTLDASDLGALLTFDFANIRYMTATHIGTWAMDKLIRFAVLPRGGEPVLWDFGSAAKHHQLFNPWLDGTERARAGISTLRGAFHPDAGIAEEVARKVATVLREHGLANEPLGVDLVEMPILFALRAEGLDVVDGQQVFLEARRIKTPDEISLLTQACSMVDAAYEELYAFLRPGVRENECVGLVSKVLYDLGSEYVEGVNAISGERCSPHPHVYSDRVVRPGDPAFFDILHSHLGYRTCYYRCFAVGSRVARDAGRLHPLPGVHGRRDRHGEAGRHHRRHRPAVADRAGVRVPRRGGGVRAAVRPRRRPVDLGEADLQPAGLARPPRGPRGGHGLRARDLLAGRRRLVGRPHRGGGRGHRRRLRGDHQVPGRGPAGRRASATGPSTAPLPTVRESQSHLNTAKGRGE